MDVILMERVEKLGQMGDVVSVKDGFARNFLLPKGKAMRATEGNRKVFEAQRAQLEARNLELKKEAEAVATRLDGKTFIVIRQASDSGNLYGSVSTRDVADQLTEGGFSVEKRQIALDKPVKELGLHPIRVILHPEVDATVTVNVARSQEEAELQAQGKSIAQLRAEEEAAEAAEFDVQSLFDPEADIREETVGVEEDESGESDEDRKDAPGAA